MNRPMPKGIVDTHVHTEPDVVPRSMSDLEIVGAADASGYRALVLKNHHVITADRAALAQRLTDRVEVLGGIALNLHATGGMNPYAVETAARLGARIVWMPTFTAENEVSGTAHEGSALLDRAWGNLPRSAVRIFDKSGKPLPELLTVLDVIAKHNLTLATGHLSSTEIMRLVPEARRKGVKRVLVNHPELASIDLSLEHQLFLADLGGVWFERVCALTLPPISYPLSRLIQAVRTVGVASTVLASDLGQVQNPHPVKGHLAFLQALADEGISMDSIEEMATHTPLMALGI